MPRRNFIDDEIFNKLASLGVKPAPLSSDEEFVRRIHLDLTGRIPSPTDIAEFLGDTAEGKRDRLIERLLVSQEFTDKWSVWFADLFQNTERLSTSNRSPQIEGRNSFQIYLQDAVANNKKLSEIATEVITAKGNNYYTELGAANYPVLASVAMGPVQDTYDMMLVRTASQFLGLAYFDCLSCHNGRGHLDGISLWAGRATRAEAQRMAAHFSRTQLVNGATAARQYEHPLFNSTMVQDATTGAYDLNTTFGNRPNRSPVGTERSFTPEYRDGTKPGAGQNWREFYASKLVADPMFARNFANRFWKAFFGLGLVDPVDTLDPARLDPRNPPADPWTLQATHPELLERLAGFLRENNTDMRAFMRLLVQSNAYQLSSSYEGEWKYEYIQTFARHYPRRLWAEEVHDAVTKATGIPGRYTWPVQNGQTIAQGTPAKQSDPVVWAMQLPDGTEPRNQTAVREFLRSFGRGNRDLTPRTQDGSILQQLNMMNDALVVTRAKVAASPVLRELAKLTDNGHLVDEIFLNFLSRRPSAYEREKAVAFLSRATARNTAVEDLAWACMNKLDFMFSY
jgi:hypothetical protein